jgi:hypothetical protein
MTGESFQEWLKDFKERQHKHQEQVLDFFRNYAREHEELKQENEALKQAQKRDRDYSECLEKSLESSNDTNEMWKEMYEELKEKCPETSEWGAFPHAALFNRIINGIIQKMEIDPEMFYLCGEASCLARMTRFDKLEYIFDGYDTVFSPIMCEFENYEEFYPSDEKLSDELRDEFDAWRWFLLREALCENKPRQPEELREINEQLRQELVEESKRDGVIKFDMSKKTLNIFGYEFTYKNMKSIACDVWHKYNH